MSTDFPWVVREVLALVCPLFPDSNLSCFFICCWFFICHEASADNVSVLLRVVFPPFHHFHWLYWYLVLLFTEAFDVKKKTAVYRVGDDKPELKTILADSMLWSIIPNNKGHTKIN